MRFLTEDLFRSAPQDSGRGFIHEGDAAVAIKTVDTFRSGVEDNQALGSEGLTFLLRSFSGHELPQLSTHADQQLGEIFVTALGSGTKERENTERSGSHAEGNRERCVRFGEGRRRA